MRKKRDFAHCSYSPRFVGNTVLRTPSLVEPLFNVVYDDGEQQAGYMSDDIYLLFNQQRLAKSLGTDTVNAWLESLQPRSDALASLRAKCSDDELLSLVKSRYIQSPCELLAWSEYLNNNMSDLLAKVGEPAPAPVDEPAPAPAEPAKTE